MQEVIPVLAQIRDTLGFRESKCFFRGPEVLTNNWTTTKISCRLV